MRYGYARVSTFDQDTAMQIEALKKSGCDEIFQEKQSAVKYRPELEAALSKLKHGDQLCAYKLDRLARSLAHLMQILDRIAAAGARVVSVTEPVDEATPAGRMMLQVLGSVAEFERSLIRERVIAGQISAIQRGVRHGRPQVLSDEEGARAVALVLSGRSISAVARDFGVGRHVIQRFYDLHRWPEHPRYMKRRPVLGPLLEKRYKEV